MLNNKYYILNAILPENRLNASKIHVFRQKMTIFRRLIIMLREAERIRNDRLFYGNFGRIFTLYSAGFRTGAEYCQVCCLLDLYLFATFEDREKPFHGLLDVYSDVSRLYLET
jgi:hypothetical protein